MESAVHVYQMEAAAKAPVGISAPLLWWGIAMYNTEAIILSVIYNMGSLVPFSWSNPNFSSRKFDEF